MRATGDQEIIMESVQTPPAIDAGRPQAAGLLNFFKRRPITAALGIWLIDVALTALFQLAAPALWPGSQADFVALFPLALIVAVALTALGWWRAVGFNRPAQWRDLRVLWLPALVVVVLPLLSGIKALDPATTLTLIVGYLLVGLREEAIYRGIMLRVLGPAGRWRAVLLSS